VRSWLSLFVVNVAQTGCATATVLSERGGHSRRRARYDAGSGDVTSWPYSRPKRSDREQLDGRPPCAAPGSDVRSPAVPPSRATPRMMPVPRARRLFVAGIAAAAFASAATPATSTSHAASCPSMYFIGVRGSGEHSGYGHTIGAVLSYIKSKIAGVKDDHIDYPAVAVGYGGWNHYLGHYVNSVKAGDRTVASYVHRFVVGPCGQQTLLVLAGYSQGAHVVGDMYTLGLPAYERNRVAGVVLLGDPRFNGTQSAVDVGDYDRTENGPFPPKRVIAAPLITSVRSYCLQHDAVCNFGATNLALCQRYPTSCPHNHYADFFLHRTVTYTQAAANFLIGRWQARGGQPHPPGGTTTGGGNGGGSNQGGGGDGGSGDGGGGGGGGGESTGPLTWSAGQQLDAPYNFLSGVSCPSMTFCVAVDRVGNVLTSTDPTAGPSAWKAVSVDSANGFAGGVSCPSVSLCAAPDRAGNVVVSTNPTGGAGAWTITHIASSTHPILTGVACPSESLCIVEDQAGEIMTSTNPTGGATDWITTHIDSRDGLNAISCATVSFCVAIDYFGGVISSVDPTGGSAAWTESLVENGGGFGPNGVACPSTQLCVIFDGLGNILSSTDPTGGASAWSTSSVDSGGQMSNTGLSGISCASTALCVALDTSVNAVTSVEPTGGVGAWTSSTLGNFGGATDVSCVAGPFCVGVDMFGRIVAGTPPSG
jgi:uncharacterized membrane protein YgcG